MKKLLTWGQVLSLALVMTPKYSVAKQVKAATRDTASIASTIKDEPLSLSEMQREIRLEHAHELLGKYYKKSAVRAGESVKKINSQIYAWVKEKLPKKYKPQYKKIAKTIIEESMKHEFDPVFL